jgi:hypothetical protein
MSLAVSSGARIIGYLIIHHDYLTEGKKRPSGTSGYVENSRSLGLCLATEENISDSISDLSTFVISPAKFPDLKSSGDMDLKLCS